MTAYLHLATSKSINKRYNCGSGDAFGINKSTECVSKRIASREIINCRLGASLSFEEPAAHCGHMDLCPTRTTPLIRHAVRQRRWKFCSLVFLVECINFSYTYTRYSRTSRGRNCQMRESVHDPDAANEREEAQCYAKLLSHFGHRLSHASSGTFSVAGPTAPKKTCNKKVHAKQ